MTTKPPTDAEAWKAWCEKHPEDRLNFRQYGGRYRRHIEGTTAYAIHRLSLSVKALFR